MNASVGDWICRWAKAEIENSPALALAEAWNWLPPEFCSDTRVYWYWPWTPKWRELNPRPSGAVRLRVDGAVAGVVELESEAVAPPKMDQCVQKRYRSWSPAFSVDCSSPGSVSLLL